MPELTAKERAVFRRLSTPALIQDFLDTLAINHEKDGETCLSPRHVLKERKAHCLEGALFAAAVLDFHNERPLLMNLRSRNGDDDHAVALFRRRGCWGALSKTNHAVLRYRDPIYPSLSALALSYFHEYYLEHDGKKTLRSYSRPLSLRRYGRTWITSEKSVWDIAYALWDAPHLPLLSKEHVGLLRRASPFERKVTGILEWKETDPRT